MSDLYSVVTGKGKYDKRRVYVSYHVALELTPEQRTRLKVAAAEKRQSVKDFVSELVVKSLQDEAAATTATKDTKKKK